MKYPKIETLLDRDGHFNVIEGKYRLPEFEEIRTWYATEKVDGTNVRIIYYPTEGIDFDYTGHKVRFAGRTDKADFHPDLTNYLYKTFTLDKLDQAFPSEEGNHPHVIVFGEGYGPKIQSGGIYRKDIAVRIFDVFIVDETNKLGGWWLEPENIVEITKKLGIEAMPCIGGAVPTDELIGLAKYGINSIVARSEGGVVVKAEGIVARSKPLLFTRRGERLMWKLKTKDFTHAK